MKIKKGLQKLRTDFHPMFWVANGMELFERLAYYGQAAVLSIFLRDHLQFDEFQAGKLSSIFGGLIYFLPIFAGALADKYGFRKSFTFAFFILAIGYFLIGATGMPPFSDLIAKEHLFWTLVAILIFTAIGGSFIKPAVLGTVSKTTTPQSKSLGYAIYYMLVNIGGAIGPAIAFLVRDNIGISYVYLVSAFSCALMFFSTLIFYKEPGGAEDAPGGLLSEKISNLFYVLTNFRFMIFLLIFSLYWIMFWQIFIIIPYFIRDFISADAPFELVESTGAWSIIFLQVLVNRLTAKLSPITAISIGFALSAITWLIIFTNPTLWVIVPALVIFAIGEMTQAPRYYEYIANLAPKGQIGLFQGYAFLPIAMGWVFGGTFGGYIYKTFAKEANNPDVIWLILAGVGALAAVLMLMYNKMVAHEKTASATSRK
ncbi:MAG: MFS transporter [Bacteroidota bacterium]|nr:MFS transporter [Bacteroidota bacterium]